MEQKEIRKIAEKYYPLSRKQIEKTDIVFMNKREKKIINFIKGFEAGLKYSKDNECLCWGNIVCSNCSKK